MARTRGGRSVWGEEGALEAVTDFAETIDALARRIEGALPTGDPLAP